MKFLLLSVGLVFTCTYYIFAQSKEEDRQKLYNDLATKDSLLFNIGFNKCNLDVIRLLITEDIEFYHDLGGVDKTQQEFINSLKNGLCKTGENPIRRELIKGSLKVFPLYDDGVLYGAIQEGIHRFPNSDSENTENSSIAQFIHLWLIENEEWKISRVFSFDHN